MSPARGNLDLAEVVTMADSIQLVSQIRDSVGALMSVTEVRKRGSGKKHPNQQQGKMFALGFVGTAWCIVDDTYVVTAQHVLNGGNPRNPKQKFYLFTVPGNGAHAHAFPVAAFPMEDQASDLAVLELGPPTDQGQHIKATPVTFSRPPDGTSVVTYGFPAPEIVGAALDDDGNFLGGGQFFLKGHASEGIVAAQYDLNGVWHFEFNVGWHHGESGGPVVTADPFAVLAVMQHYRYIKGPHGMMDGPRRGRALDVIQQTLSQLGATIV
jgi:hypothetical protein